MNRLNFEFHPKFVLRTPLLSFKDYSSFKEIEELISQDHIEESIFFASPSLYAKIKNGADEKSKNKSEKLKISIYKYISRMTTRSTPFGLFAGCSIVNWGTETLPLINNASKINRKTKINTCNLNEISDKIKRDEGLQHVLEYYLNDTIYKHQKVVFYVESHKGEFRLSEVENSPFLNFVIKVFGINHSTTLPDLRKLFFDEFSEFSEMEIEEYINSLVDSQILLCTLAPNFNSTDYVDEIINLIKKNDVGAKLKEIGNVLESTKLIMADLDRSQYNTISKYTKLNSRLKEIGFNKNAPNYLNVTLFKEESEKAILNRRVQDEITIVTNTLEKFLPEKKNSVYIDSFINMFYERYEGREVPLLEVLNPNIGLPIDYHRKIEIKNKKNELSLVLDGHHRFLHKLLIEAYSKNSGIIQIENNKINTFSLKTNSQFKRYTAFFSLFSDIDDENSYMHIKSISNSDSSKLLGRFTLDNDKIKDIVSDVNKKSLLPNNLIEANLLFFPESKGGDVISHSIFKDHTISCLVFDDSYSDKKIKLSDLGVSINYSQKRIYLRSISRNKYVLPKLGNAHNYKNSKSVIYRFLCELENHHQEKNLTFTWGSLYNLFTYFPRVQISKSVISRATWILKNTDFQELLIHEVSKEFFFNWLKKYKIPKSILFIEGDNELYLNFELEIGRATFLSLIKKKKEINIQEFLFNKEKCPIKDLNLKSYTNEVIVTYHNKCENIPTLLPQKTVKHHKKYNPHSEWNYFKIYCNEVNAEYVILRIMPIIARLTSLKKIEKWFFVRYYDPNFHLRLRIKSFEEFDKDVFQAINKKLDNLLKKKQLWDLHIGIYTPEKERYGKYSLLQCEQVFFNDSLATGKLIKKLKENYPLELRYVYSLLSTKEYLINFEIKDNQLTEFSWLQYKNLAREHMVTKGKKYEMNDNFRKLMLSISSYEDKYPIINTAIQSRTRTNSSSVKIINELYKEKSKKERSKKMSIVASIIHMSMNRLFENNQRYHEMVVYYYLFKHEKSELMKQKYAVKNKKI